MRYRLGERVLDTTALPCRWFEAIPGDDCIDALSGIATIDEGKRVMILSPWDEHITAFSESEEAFTAELQALPQWNATDYCVEVSLSGTLSITRNDGIPVTGAEADTVSTQIGCTLRFR